MLLVVVGFLNFSSGKRATLDSLGFLERSLRPPVITPEGFKGVLVLEL
jgi:hypothetical protein